MSSNVDIANLALTMLGDLRITALTDNSKPAREISAVYDMLRDKLQRRYVWNFTKTRVILAADVETPADDEYTNQYTIPTDCLRILQVGDYYPSITLSSGNGGRMQDYSIERGKILYSDDGALTLRYCARISNPGEFDSAFVVAFAAYIATTVCEALTPSNTKREIAFAEFKQAISDAVRANAIENPPEELADDTWILARR